jgi:tetratricopeptide (TPR) repeat protein
MNFIVRVSKGSAIWGGLGVFVGLMILATPARAGESHLSAGVDKSSERGLDLFRAAEAHFNLGVTYVELGRWKEAVKAFQQATRFNPGLAEAYNGLAVAQGRLGRYDQAIQACNQALRINPQMVKAHYNLAAFYLALGDIRSANEHRQALETLDQKLASGFQSLVRSRYTVDVSTLVPSRRSIPQKPSVNSDPKRR